jgi:cation:H+ antiporter
LIGLIFSAELVVNSGLDIAVALGAPPILIGAKIIALGTSLPELATSIQAARIGRVQLAIGNVLGSNLSNITLILGLTLITTPFTVDLTVFTEILPFLLISTIVFWRFLARGGITRVGGAILLATYIVFLVLI